MLKYILIYKYYDSDSNLVDSYRVFYDLSQMNSFKDSLLSKFSNVVIWIFKSTTMEIIL